MRSRERTESSKVFELGRLVVRPGAPRYISRRLGAVGPAVPVERLGGSLVVALEAVDQLLVGLADLLLVTTTDGGLQDVLLSGHGSPP